MNPDCYLQYHSYFKMNLFKKKKIYRHKKGKGSPSDITNAFRQRQNASQRRIDDRLERLAREQGISFKNGGSLAPAGYAVRKGRGC